MKVSPQFIGLWRRSAAKEAQLTQERTFDANRSIGEVCKKGEPARVEPNWQISDGIPPLTGFRRIWWNAVLRYKGLDI
jgi:hypothetical protein